MNQKTLNAFADCCRGKTFSYCGAEEKDAMHRKGRAALKQIAKGLGLEPGTFDIRSNKAGIACSGEITLHHDEFYFQMQPDSFMRGKEILVRSCNGRKDYTGGGNTFISIEDLRDWDTVASAINRVSKVAAHA